MTEPKAPKAPGWRPDVDHRRISSLHDWYGLGVLDGVNRCTDANTARIGFCFVRRSAMRDQYLKGYADGARLRLGRGGLFGERI